MQASSLARPGDGRWLRPGARSWATASLAVSRSTNSDGRSTSFGRCRAGPVPAGSRRLSLSLEAEAGSGKLNVDLRSRADLERQVPALTMTLRRGHAGPPGEAEGRPG